MSSDEVEVIQGESPLSTEEYADDDFMTWEEYQKKLKKAEANRRYREKKKKLKQPPNDDPISTWEEYEKRRKAAEASRRYRERQKYFYLPSNDDNSLCEEDEKKRKRAEANRRYREKKRLLMAKAPKPNPRTPPAADYSKACRELKKLQQPEAEDCEISSSSVSSKILKAMNNDTESDQFKAEIRYQEILPKELNLQDSEMNFDEFQETSVQDSMSTGNQSDSDEISMSDIVPVTEDFAKMSPAEKAAEAARRYRLLKKLLKPTKPPARTASERSKAYRERQKSLQRAAKLILKDSKINFNQKEAAIQEVIKKQCKSNDDANIKQRSPPKTPGERSKEYRERKKRLIMTAVEDIAKKQLGSLPENNTLENTENDNETVKTETRKPLRYVLTLDERLAAIRQFDNEAMYNKIAQNFNCSLEQIIRVVSNRKAILEFHEATVLLSKQSKEDSELRRRKLNLLGYCVYEYTQRARFHLLTDVSEEDILQRAIEFRNLMGIDGFTPNKSWINQFMAAYDINFSKNLTNFTQRPRISLDLKNIMSHCVRHSAMASNLEPRVVETVDDIEQLLDHAKNLQKNSEHKQGTSIDLEFEDEVNNVSVTMDIEDKDDIDNLPGTPLIEELNDNSHHNSSLEIEQLHHSPIHICDYQLVDDEMPAITTAFIPSHNSEIIDEPPLPRNVKNFKDALLLLKPLEDFALMRENYRVIGLISQLEQIFEAGKKAEEVGSLTE
nr:trichohyalin-like isoform X2 [Drosophila kikkawai]